MDRHEIFFMLAQVGHGICDFSQKENAEPSSWAFLDGKTRVRFLNVEGIEINSIVDILNHESVALDVQLDSDEVLLIVGVAKVDRICGEFLHRKDGQIRCVRRQVEWGEPVQRRIQCLGKVGEGILEFQFQLGRHG